jgi:hypothetical protein
VIANTMENEVDSALITRPRGGGEPFRIAQEQQIATERHRVEAARLQAEQQRLLTQKVTAEALTKQYLEVPHDLRTSSNLVLMVPTEGGIPVREFQATILPSYRRTASTTSPSDSRRTA